MKPSGSFTSWENTMCNPLGDRRTQNQDAWHDGYASAIEQAEKQELVGLTFEPEREWFWVEPEQAEKKEWVGLTDEEIEKMRHLIDWTAGWSYLVFARAVEAKLKEKNND